MIPAKDKAIELVNKMDGYVHYALISVGTILDEYQSISDLESTLVVGGQVMSIVDKIVYWEEVEREIVKL
jgi:hypothetical protein